jgi:hypothetical protein
MSDVLLEKVSTLHELSMSAYDLSIEDDDSISRDNLFELQELLSAIEKSLRDLRFCDLK